MIKILIYGAGVIGCTYGWQMATAGCNVTMLVRKEKLQQWNKNGVNIRCADYRGVNKKVIEANFRPAVITELSPENNFDYIIVATNSLQVNTILPELSKGVGKATIVFFQNIWDTTEIEKYLSTNQYLFGFPFMAGGGKDETRINSIILESKYSKTIVGEVSGQQTPRLLKFVELLDKADMKPFVSDQILNWLIPHGVFIAAISAGILSENGSMSQFIKNTKTVKTTVRAIREGFRICESRGIDPKKEKVNKLYYLPLFISVPIVKKIMSSPEMGEMFEGYLNHSTNEVKRMLEDIAQSGVQHRIEIPCLESLYKR